MPASPTGFPRDLPFLPDFSSSVVIEPAVARISPDSFCSRTCRCPAQRHRKPVYSPQHVDGETRRRTHREDSKIGSPPNRTGPPRLHPRYRLPQPGFLAGQSRPAVSSRRAHSQIESSHCFISATSKRGNSHFTKNASSHEIVIISSTIFGTPDCGMAATGQQSIQAGVAPVGRYTSR